MAGEPQPLSVDELTAIERKWLGQCGPCDYGLPGACTHPHEDYRPVMARLNCDIWLGRRRAAAELAETRAERDRLRRLAAELLSQFVEVEDRPDRPRRRSRWVEQVRLLDWHRTYREVS